MSEFGQNLKDLVIKGIDAIGNTASSLASSTRHKVNEIALKGKRNEILEAFGEKAYEAWKNGTDLPEELAADLKEVLALDEELARVRNETAGRNEESEAPQETEAADENEKTGDTAEPQQPEVDSRETEDADDTQTAKIPVIEVPETEEEPEKNVPLCDAIDQLFGKKTEMDEMAGKINSSLDEMGRQLLQFSSDFGKKLSDMADDLMNNNDHPEE